jgi:hypothetical protein
LIPRVGVCEHQEHWARVRSCHSVVQTPLPRYSKHELLLTTGIGAAKSLDRPINIHLTAPHTANNEAFAGCMATVFF